MGMNPLAWLWPVLFYLVGSIPTGYLMGRVRGLDIRRHGSGNIGATNVWRVMGRTWGLAAFACDFLKGFLVLFLVRRIEFHHDHSWNVSLLLVVCALAVVIGHNYTPWLGFRGGKGIATSAGILAALMPWALLVVFTLWLVLVLITRTVSIGSIAAALALPPAAFFFYRGDWIYFGLSIAAAIMAIWRHSANIKRLLAGAEPKLGASKKDTA
jgi:acyl phosphate:glycerol-3-phosphate acyltransferase